MTYELALMERELFKSRLWSGFFLQNIQKNDRKTAIM